jgi:hypothetical protein
MHDRLQEVLARRGITRDEAVTEALMHWICDEEVSWARRDRLLSAAELTPALRDALQDHGDITVRLEPQGHVTIGHHHPFLGTLIVDDMEALNGWLTG